MGLESAWTAASWAASVTGRAWTYSPYDAGWESCRQVPELRRLHAEEVALGQVPAWARQVVERVIASPLPPCGHYRFPQPILQACRAIAAATYQMLDEPTELRVLLVRRLVRRLRWWLRTLVWSDDRRNRFAVDQYLGDARGDGRWGCYGNPPLADPYFAELREPEAAALAERIRSQVPDGPALVECIESTWLCAPKAFRYVQRLVARIGAVGAGREPDFAPRLHCEDTYPDLTACREWHQRLLAGLDGWLEAGDEAAAANTLAGLCELGPRTPVRHWLVGLLRLRLVVYAGFTQYLGGVAGGRSGTQPGPGAAGGSR